VLQQQEELIEDEEEQEAKEEESRRARRAAEDRMKREEETMLAESLLPDSEVCGLSQICMVWNSDLYLAPPRAGRGCPNDNRAAQRTCGSPFRSLCKIFRY
jgi:hypothetical protein